VCLSCGAASDIESALPGQLMQQLTSRTGYAITRYDLQFHGLCPACQSRPEIKSDHSHQQEESHG